MKSSYNVVWKSVYFLDIVYVCFVYFVEISTAVAFFLYETINPTDYY